MSGLGVAVWALIGLLALLLAVGGWVLVLLEREARWWWANSSLPAEFRARADREAGRE